jgi:CMP-N-acetylneuraminic acid synthetase
MSKKGKNDKQFLEPIKLPYVSQTLKNQTLKNTREQRHIIKINQISKKILAKNNINYINDNNDLIEKLFIYKSKRKLYKKK